MDALGVIGAGALSRAMVLALHRAWPALQFHLSPRNAQTVEALRDTTLSLIHI